MERPEASHRFVDGAARLAFLGQVGHEGQNCGARHVQADGGRRRVDHRAAGVDEHHGGALLGEEAARRRADAPTAARNERGASGHPPGHAGPSGEGEVAARRHHHARHGPVEPALARLQHDGGRPHEE
jgi:hypothetical protein